MAEPVLLQARSAFAGALAAIPSGPETGSGREPRSDHEAGVTISEPPGLQLATLIARRDGRSALADRMKASLGLDLPNGPKRSVLGTTSVLGTGPRTWLVVEEAGTPDLAGRLARAVGPAAAVADQSDGYAVLRIAGAGARDTLAKGLPIDLHPRAFGPNDVAVTSCTHIGVTFWQVDDAPTFDIAVFRSLAGSFSGWLFESAAEFGMRIV